MERSGSPSLLPILRSRQQAELLADLLDNPGREQSLADLGRRLGIPAASVHREVQRAEQAGLVRSRQVGRTRLVAADATSPYFRPLRELMVKAFGVPARLAHALADLDGIDQVFIFGSWAARWHGEDPERPVGDIDVLVLGDPDRTELYGSLQQVGLEVGRVMQPQIRPTDWLEAGTGSFHSTVVSRPMVKVYPSDPVDRNAPTSSTAREAT